MLQFYFLSVASLVLGGFSLIYAASEESTHSFRRFIASRSVRISIGAVAVIVGVVKFFIRAPLDEIVVVGDILPALAGIAIGLALLAEALVRREDTAESLKKIRSFSRFYRLPLGIVGIGAGLAHFFVPSVVIL